jgi:hypothetical protein
MPSIPPKTHPVWLRLVTGSKKIELDLLPAKLLLGRVEQEIQENPSLGPVHAAALHGLYEKFQKSPNAERDLARLA